MNSFNESKFMDLNLNSWVNFSNEQSWKATEFLKFQSSKSQLEKVAQFDGPY